MKTLNDLAEAKKTYISAIEENGKKFITEAVMALLTEYPVIEALKWHQYVPAFNDGDACTFSVSEIYVKLVGAEAEEDGEEFISIGDGGDNEAMQAVSKLDDVFDGLYDVLEIVFGQDAQVTATREGFAITDSGYGY